jgi:hypothetical protein
MALIVPLAQAGVQKGPPVKNTPTCWGKTKVLRSGAIRFVARCDPPRTGQYFPLDSIETDQRIKSVRPVASVGGTTAGMSCSRTEPMLIDCTSLVDDPTSQTVAGQFKVKAEPCELTTAFNWFGGACRPGDTRPCPAYAIVARREFGPPAGC